MRTSSWNHTETSSLSGWASILPWIGAMAWLALLSSLLR